MGGRGVAPAAGRYANIDNTAAAATSAASVVRSTKWDGRERCVMGPGT